MEVYGCSLSSIRCNRFGELVMFIFLIIASGLWSVSIVVGRPKDGMSEFLHTEYNTKEFFLSLSRILLGGRQGARYVLNRMSVFH